MRYQLKSCHFTSSAKYLINIYTSEVSCIKNLWRESTIILVKKKQTKQNSPLFQTDELFSLVHAVSLIILLKWKELYL